MFVGVKCLESMHHFFMIHIFQELFEDLSYTGMHHFLLEENVGVSQKTESPEDHAAACLDAHKAN